MNQESLTPEDQGTNGTTREKAPVPFEDPSKDFFSGLFETMKLVLFQPGNFFRNYKLDGPIGKPLLFALLIGWFSSAVAMVWGLFISESIFQSFGRFRELFPEIEGVDWDQLEQLSAREGTFDFILGVVLAPVLILLVMFIVAGIYHLFLMVIKGANRNFETTFNVVAYGSAAHIFEIIPFCGNLISWVYGIVLAVIGLTEAHETDSWKAVFAVFAPMVLCCFCCIMFLFALGGTASLVPILEKVPWN
jgi:hypothetical protein